MDNPEDEARYARERARFAQKFCHHGKSLLEQCTACEDEEDNR